MDVSLPAEVTDWLQRARAHPGVTGIALTGSTARQETWPGSDLDIYLFLAEGPPADLPGSFSTADRYVDVHHLSGPERLALATQPEAFARSGVIDETAGLVPLHDPHELVAEWGRLVARRLADPTVRHRRAAVRLEQAATALAAARAAGDPLVRAWLARDAAAQAAFAHVVGTGGLVASARRFAETYRARFDASWADALWAVWGLSDSRRAVEDALAGLRLAIAAAIEVQMEAPAPEAHGWVGPYGTASAEQRAAFLASQPLPELLGPALAFGHHAGALMWMRGYFRFHLDLLLRPVAPERWPRDALQAFFGCSGAETEQAAGLVEGVTAAVGQGGPAQPAPTQL